MDHVTHQSLRLAIPLLAFCAMGVSTSAFSQVVDGVAAVVNKRVITFSEVKKEVDPIERSIMSSFSGLDAVEKVKEARLSALKALIERELIIDDFEANGLFLPDNVIEDRMKGIIKAQYENDRSAFIKTLQANGISVATFKDNLRSSIIVQAMRARNVSSSIIISPYQIEQYYQENIKQFVQPDQIKLRVIFMKRALFKEKRKKADGSVVEVDPQEQVMKEILTKIDTGSDFASLAKGYSDGPHRSKGGLMGWVTRETLRTELADAAFSMRPGQNSQIINTKEGFYIVMVDDIRKSTVIPLIDVREEIESTLMQQEKERLQQEWLDSLRAKAFIKMFF